MPFRKKKSPFWHYDFQLDGRRFSGSCGTEDYREARAIEAAARVAAKAAVTAVAPGRFTLSQAIGTYCQDVCQHQPSGRTSLSQGRAILEVLPPNLPIEDLTSAHLMHFVARRRAEVSNATVNRTMQFLGRALRHMKRFHDAKIPDLNLKAAEVKEPQERIRELSWDEQAALFKHLRPDLHPFVKFALMTGARRATICALRWRDVDLAHARIRFAMKGDRTMFFPVNGELRAFLSALPRATAPALAGRVFTYVNQVTAERAAISATGGGVHDDFHQATLKAGIEDFRFHDLRHTFATRMLRKTGNLKLVSRLLGHASIETTMRYAHVLDEDLHEALADFSALDGPALRAERARQRHGASDD